MKYRPIIPAEDVLDATKQYASGRGDFQNPFMTPAPKSKKLQEQTDLMDFNSIERSYGVGGTEYKNKNKHVDISGYFGQPLNPIKGMGTYSANQILSHKLRATNSREVPSSRQSRGGKVDEQSYYSNPAGPRSGADDI